jgi:cobalt-zinc-cadmium efflux system protein
MTHDHHHHDGHDHARDAGHTHANAPKHLGVAFAIGTVLNLGFVIVEATYGLLANSIALLADACHNLGDVLGLAMAWVATVLARRAPSRTFTYGLGSGTILAALANAVLLLVTVGAIAVEGVRRLLDPGEVASITVMVVAALGIIVNGVAAWLFASGRKDDINLRGAFVHMAYDALISLGVVIAGGAILLTGWARLDPLVSLAIAGVILVGTWNLLRESVGMSLDAVPAGIDPDEVGKFLEQQLGVAAIHDLHIWPMSTTETAMTAHLVMPGGNGVDSFLHDVAAEMHARFGIGHTTLQIERDASACALEPPHIV